MADFICEDYCCSTRSCCKSKCFSRLLPRSELLVSEERRRPSFSIGLITISIDFRVFQCLFCSDAPLRHRCLYVDGSRLMSIRDKCFAVAFRRPYSHQRDNSTAGNEQKGRLKNRERTRHLPEHNFVSFEILHSESACNFDDIFSVG